MKQEKILFLGEKNSPLFLWLIEQGENVTQFSDILSNNFVYANQFTFLISYGYRHIIKKNILDLFPNSAINLHISYLPWNRGSDPNLWSFIEQTKKGVTIHLLDEGVDTGDIIVQEKVDFDMNKETLSSSYHKLQKAVQKLFKERWNDIKQRNICTIKAKEIGTYHAVKDKNKILPLLIKGWDTQISHIINN